VIHASAVVETDRIGAGTRVWAFTQVGAGAAIGTDCNIGSHCYIESGVVIGDAVTIKNGNSLFAGVHLEDGVFVGPGVVFTNDRFPRSPRYGLTADRYDDPAAWLTRTRVCSGATLGGGAVVVAGATIGELALVAAGAVVTADVPPQALVLGNPARRVGWVCHCGHRLELSDGRADCRACGRAYETGEEGLLGALPQPAPS
jgi:acetyltransferase-like isoleucine patch superfamily enzyme